jgi:hypothetical protein
MNTYSMICGLTGPTPELTLGLTMRPKAEMKHEISDNMVTMCEVELVGMF